MLKSQFAIQTITSIVTLACVVFPLCDAAAQTFVTAKRITILIDPEADATDARIAEVLKSRFAARSAVSVFSTQPSGESAELTIYLGTSGRQGNLDKLCAAHGVKLPGRKEPVPEGFAIKTVTINGIPSVLAVGVDHRGTLYAVGEFLRRVRFEPDAIVLDDLDLCSAPAYRFRGSSANQGGTMMQITGARPWTAEEWQEYMLDLSLSGANCFYAGGAAFDFVKSFDMMVETGCRPNELAGAPKAWRATEMGNWVCPSIPEAHAALLKRWDEDFQKRQNYDVLRFFAGDPGGCRCEKCTPWGKTFIHLCEDIAQIWLKSHPNTVILAANQDLDNAGDQAIFDYLNETPRTWLYGLAYGPGSNAMSGYFRSELREDLFTYPGAGPVNRYLAETLNQLPKYQRIVHYSDITHWISAQYQVEHPDPYVKAFYGRRTFHTRPKAFYRIFQAIMPFSEGDIIYSEGYHDEFHQYLWNRLLWNPNRSLDDVTLEYCRYQFGENAAEFMKEAIYQLEENLEAPFASNPGIDRYYSLVAEAGRRIPPHLMAGNHRWRLHMQKAALDKYLQRKVQIALNQEARIRRIAQDAVNEGKPNAALDEIKAVLAEGLETPQMTALRKEARRLGEESNVLFGVRNVGYFSLDRPFRSLVLFTRLVNEAAGKSKSEKRQALTEIAAYEPSPKFSPILPK